MRNLVGCLVCRLRVLVTLDCEQSPSILLGNFHNISASIQIAYVRHKSHGLVLHKGLARVESLLVLG